MGTSLRHFPGLGVGILVLTGGAGQAYAASGLRVGWEQLRVVTGKTVSIVMPGGAVVSGKAVRVEPDALVVDIRKTTDECAYPKSELRVGRDKLRVLEMQRRRHVFARTLATAGVMLGLAAGAGVQSAADGCSVFEILGNCHASAGGTVAIVGFTALGGVSGYFGGRAADTHRVTIEIVPQGAEPQGGSR